MRSIFEVGSHLASANDTQKKQKVKEPQVLKHSEAIRPFKGSQFKRVEARPCMLLKNVETKPYKRK